nr:hypothetical protein [Mycobacterium interjectum]
MNDQPAGTGTTMASSVIAVGANALCGNSPITASPGRTDVSGPASRTTPAASLPMPSSAMAPSATTTSRKFSPAART